MLNIIIGAFIGIVMVVGIELLALWMLFFRHNK